MISTLEPLSFVPLIKSHPWGGRRLERALHKSLPEDVPCGESWEIVDLPGDQSVVASGALSGQSLESLVASHQPELLGDTPLLEGRFPLLFKFIDAADTLSVQVHPNEEMCASLGDGARPKTEAWYILDADPGACLYLGLKPGVFERELRDAIEVGSVAPLLQQVFVRPGDFIYLPSGTLHAIGKGVLLAEIQQSSDTTYRVFDWNRLGLDGRPRQLHIEQALSSIDFALRGLPPHEAPDSGRPGIKCELFSFELLALAADGKQEIPETRAVIVSCIRGAGVLATDSISVALRCGQSCLVPNHTRARLSAAESVWPDESRFLLVSF